MLGSVSGSCVGSGIQTLLFVLHFYFFIFIITYFFCLKTQMDFFFIFFRIWIAFLIVGSASYQFMDSAGDLGGLCQHPLSPSYIL